MKQMAAVAHLSLYRFARQFKVATGLPPHQYVIARRVERAQQLLHEDDLPLAEVAAHTGISDQRQFSRHFKRRRRRPGVIPGARKNRLRRPNWLKLSEPRPLGVSRAACS
jgi:AraC family transcriptional regulator